MDNTVILFLVIAIIIVFLIFLTESYNKTDEIVITQIRYDLEYITPGINNLCIITSGDSTYTENKKNVYILLKDDRGQYYDYNTLIYASIHEISHVLCPDLDHSKRFVIIFRKLLDRAEISGIYVPHRVNVDYCKTCMV
jgi:hypothetical protein